MALTDAAIRNAKPRHKVCRMFDGLGLYLEVTPKGGRLCRWKYRQQGKEKRSALGVYPRVDPQRGREKCAEARELRRTGTDPGEAREASSSSR